MAPMSSSSSRRCSGRNLGVHELSVCEQLTVDLVRHEDSWPFMKLVSRTQVHHINIDNCDGLFIYFGSLNQGSLMLDKTFVYIGVSHLLLIWGPMFFLH